MGAIRDCIGLCIDAHITQCEIPLNDASAFFKVRQNCITRCSAFKNPTREKVQNLVNSIDCSSFSKSNAARVSIHAPTFQSLFSSSFNLGIKTAQALSEIPFLSFCFSLPPVHSRYEGFFQRYQAMQAQRFGGLPAAAMGAGFVFEGTSTLGAAILATP